MKWLISGLATLACCAGLAAQDVATVNYKVDPSKVENTVDARIYGQFLEHIFNSVHGGLWGDMILNPSLEAQGGGGWMIKDDSVMSSQLITDQKLIFGDDKWGDYELTLEARKIEGAEGFIVMFRVADPGRFYWVNFGGWANREHGLQKNGGAMGKHAKGKIESGRWYKVRIRCEGPRIQAFLDDQLLLDDTDADGPILKGAVGLNGWNSKVEFRNIKVTDLAGKTCFMGLPPRNALAAKPAYWQFFGNATFSNEGSEPFNGASSLRIHSQQASGESGIRQSPMMVRKGEHYTGSIHLKGEATAGVKVRLLDDKGDEVFATILRDIGPKWKKLAFEVTADRTVENAIFEVALAGTGDVSLDMVSLFSKSALNHGGFRPDVLQAIQDLKPATIRYPGGCFASAYRWKDAIGPRENRKYFPNIIWADQDPNQMGTDEFMDLCKRVGAEPILPVNMNLSVQEALDWVEYCNGDASTQWGAQRAKNGHPEPYHVKLWEIDNETWGMGPERYGEVVSKFSQALRGKDPSIKIIACGGYGYDDGKGSSNGWNKHLLDKCAKDFDFLSIHYYNGIMYAQDFIDDPRRYEAYMRDDVGKLIKDSANPSIRIYCSEWGMMNDEWCSGLYTGGILNGFERQSELVPMTCPAVWLQTVSANRQRPRWASCLILFDHKTCFGAPSWVVEKLWREHFAPKRLLLDGPDLPLNTVATQSEDAHTLYLKSVNPTKHPVNVRLATSKAFTNPQAELLVVSGRESDRNSLAEPTKLAPGPQPVRLEAGVICFTMPALSAGVLTLRSAEITERELGAFQRPKDGQDKNLADKRGEGVLAEITKMASFEKWKTFEDNYVKFSYPDHEAITLEVKTNEPIAVDGDRVSDVDVSYSRAYRLVVSGTTLTALMLSDAVWLDDGICLCGAIDYDRYLIRNGNLYRFSFLKSGILKKMQVLDDRERLMMFEWTHSPIHPAVYRRIAQSVELKRKGPWKVDECRKDVMDRYGPKGVVGWFDEGTTAETVEHLLGRPARTAGNGTQVWEYPKEKDGYRWTERLSLPFVDGKLIRFDSSFYDFAWDHREAMMGTIPWMQEKAQPYEDPLVRGAEAETMPEDLKKVLLGLFLEKAKDADADFDGLCQVLRTLVRQGVQDEQALDIVRRRFAREGGQCAAWVLHEVGHKEDVDLFIEKIREVYRVANQKHDDNIGLSSDLHNWLAFIPDDDERYPGLLREGLTSPNASVREESLFFIHTAPFLLDERLSFVRSALRDPNNEIRRLAARYYDRSEMSDNDWNLLKDAAEQEKDKFTLKEMNKVLEGREKQRTGK